LEEVSKKQKKKLKKKQKQTKGFAFAAFKTLEIASRVSRA